MATPSGTKTVLITGANRGIGFAFAQYYQAQGWRVIATARNPTKATQLQALNPYKLVQLDVTDETLVQQAAKDLDEDPIDLLINNAGIGSPPSTLADTTKKMLTDTFEVNAVGAFIVTQAFLPHLHAAVQYRGGATVAVMSSEFASIGENQIGRFHPYRMAKAALNMFAKSAAVELKPSKIVVVALHPGLVDTDMSRGENLESQQDLLGTMIQPKESATALAGILERATLDDTGSFFHWQGHTIAW